LDRPIVFGALKGIQQKLGKNKFPLIDQTYYTNHMAMVVTPDVPFVAKVGHAHAGYGKVKLTSQEAFADFKSLAALHGDYITAEPFIDWDFDMRIQKIGSHYRGFKRTSPNWKGNTGNASILSDMDMTEEYKLWIDECSKLFGGLDICALDLLHSKVDGKDYILELNDTAIGLVHKYEQEDMMFIRDIVMNKLEECFPLEPKPKKTIDEGDIKLLQSELALTKIELERERQQRKELEEKLKEPEEDPKKKKKFGLF